MIYAVLIIAAVALGLAAFALYVAIAARSRAIDAESRIARHQREHRLGAEEDGLRRHRAAAPSTEQIAAQRPSGSTRAEPAGVDLEEHPATGLISAAEPPPAGPYAQLRRNAEQRADTGDLPATAAHAAVPRRPGSAPNFTEPPPARPTLPPPGRIDRDR